MKLEGNKKYMKNIKKTMKIALLVIVILLICLFVNILINKKEITLTQLSPQTGTQMMGYVIKTKNNKLIVIDGGLIDDAENLMKYIEKNNNKVDYWFLTHNHNDHTGAFTEIVNNKNVDVENVYVSLNNKEWYEENEIGRAEFSHYLIETLNNEKIAGKVKSPNVNEKFQIDEIQVEILGIRNPEIVENPGNEQSMVIKFDTGKTTILILGDTGEKSSEKLLESQKEKLKSDIVQMAHHGQAGATKQLYEKVNPTTCLWPTPEWLWNNDAGNGTNTGPWKTMETRKWMNEIGVKKNYIAKDGDCTIKIK